MLGGQEQMNPPTYAQLMAMLDVIAKALKQYRQDVEKRMMAKAGK